MMVIVGIIVTSIVISWLMRLLVRWRNLLALSIASAMIVALLFQMANAVILGYVDPFIMIALPISFALSFATSLVATYLFRRREQQIWSKSTNGAVEKRP